MDDPHYNRLYSTRTAVRQPPARTRQAQSRPRQPEVRRVDQARLAAAQRRDAAFARIGSTRRWVIAGAAGLSAAFAALVSALAPGHSLSSAHAATGGAGTATPVVAGNGQPPMPAAAGPSALGLAGGGGSTDDSSSPPAPAQSAPAPAPAPPASSPPVSSGGS